VVAQAVARFYVGYPCRAELPVFFVVFVVSELVAVPLIAAIRAGAVIQVAALVLEVPVMPEWQGWVRGARRWCSRSGGL